MERSLSLQKLSHESHVFLASLLALGFMLLSSSPVHAQVELVQLSKDTFMNPSSQHATEVEPDSYSYGSTIVTAFQVARIFSGGGADIGFATSTNSGAAWTNGYLPGITKAVNPSNPYDAVSDAAVVYDAAYGVWLISSLPLVNSGAPIPAVIVSRSTDGVNWDNPVSVGPNVDSSDKDWITCDNSATSRYYGNCYVEWDNPAQGNLIYMSTSTDGGQTWSPARNTANFASGIGGEPLVQPNGTVVVPIDDAFEGSVMSFRSTNGGISWSSTVTVAGIFSHNEAGGLRSGPLPAAAEDFSGNLYVIWSDCRFRTNCAENDLVLSTSADGITWTAPARIPIDPVSSTVDHFLPGLAVDATSPSPEGRLALVYYYYPQTNCTTSTCQLDVGFVFSTSGGKTWYPAIQLAGPMTLTWLPNTFSGYMVGDYFASTYSALATHGYFAVAKQPVGSTFNQAMYTQVLAILGEQGRELSSATGHPVANPKSDHPPLKHPALIR
ncbi:MAG: sialidase family protein [Terriglobia bacterium]